MRVLACVALLLIASVAVAQPSVEEVRTWNGPERTRVVFDLSAPLSHELFMLSRPDRAVLDLHDADIAAELVADIRDIGPIERVRTGQRADGARVVLDLAYALSAESFPVAPNDTYGHRLVVDLHHANTTIAADGQPRADAKQTQAPVRTAQSAAPDEFVVAIDAGHGGEDPGAIGAAGTYEKDIVLMVARKLADRVNAVRGLRAVLIRDGDYYIGLRERTRKARDVNADLFISLHADAFHDRRVKGSSVFVLSRNGASSEMARMVAQRENQADQIGGVSLAGKDEQLASVLVDLSRAHTVEESVGVAKVLLTEMDALGDVHGGGVEQAGFAVLKSLDMPSVLVELAFISNPEEERRLKSSDYQRRLSAGILHGIKAYVARQRPNLQLAGGEYVVRRGDTLSEIAQQHAVSVQQLRQANNIGNDAIATGVTLQIP